MVAPHEDVRRHWGRSRRNAITRSSRREPRAAGVQGGIRAACPGPQRVVRATRSGLHPPRPHPGPQPQGGQPGGLRNHSAQRHRHPDGTVRRPPDPLRAGPLPRARPAHPPRPVRPRPRALRLLRGRRDQRRPRHSAQPGRPAPVGQRRGGLPPLQPHQGGPPPHRAGLADEAPPAPPIGLAWRVIGTGIKDPRWRPYLEPYGGLEQFREYEHHDHLDHAGALPVPAVRTHPHRRGEPEPLSA